MPEKGVIMAAVSRKAQAATEWQGLRVAAFGFRLSLSRAALQRREPHRADTRHHRWHHRSERPGLAVRSGLGRRGALGALGLPARTDPRRGAAHGAAGGRRAAAG